MGSKEDKPRRNSLKDAVKAIFKPNSVSPSGDDSGKAGKALRQPLPKDPYAGIEETPVPARNCPILKLPMRERVLIWQRVENVKALRLTCSRIKSDIDHFVGLHGILDENIPSFGFFGTVGLQSISVVELVTEANITHFLLHPLLLKRLYVFGEISSSYFAYITEYCPYITCLKINFSPKTISKRVYFFPILSQHWSTERTFQFLEVIHLEAITRRNPELTYMRDNITAFFTKDLPGNRIIKKIKVCITHKAFSAWDMKLIHEIVSNFINANARTLTHICIEMMDKYLDEGIEARTDFVQKLLRRGSADMKDVLASSTGERKPNNDLTGLLSRMTDATTAIQLKDWHIFVKLDKLFLSVNGEYCEYWKTAFTKAPVLSHLYLELKMNNNWPVYCSFIQPAAKTLAQIYCYEVTRDRGVGSSTKLKHIDIDARVFKKCKKLNRLSLNFAINEQGARYNLLHLGKVPRRLIYLEFSWIVIHPCDIANLALTHRRLLHLDISYWSITDQTFARLWCLFRWICCCHLTSLTRLTITDSKMRFQSERQAVLAFLNAERRHARFRDVDETCIIFDRRPQKIYPEKSKLA